MSRRAEEGHGGCEKDETMKHDKIVAVSTVTRACDAHVSLISRTLLARAYAHTHVKLYMRTCGHSHTRRQTHV